MSQNRIGFDNEKYLSEQTARILERIGKSDNKLYLEFGGKILFDYHAARVLPGFDPNVKMRLLQKLKDKADIILCIYAGDIERKKVRADFGITYDWDAMKLIDDLKQWGLDVCAVVITRYKNQPSANLFRDKLERRGVVVHTHQTIKGYPTDVDAIVSEAGYGSNAFVKTGKPLVVVTGPGPGSGKLATCLNQIYHEHKNGVDAGYAKFETFPIWNIPLNHPVNIAYEAATADIGDFNQIDPHHEKAYGERVVNYNRDVEVFPVLKEILQRIMGSAVYQSPTDMGVNCAGFGIVNDAVVCEAARQEIIRRYFRYSCEYAMGLSPRKAVHRAEEIMRKVGAEPTDRKAVRPARTAAEEGEAKGKGNEGIFCGAAIELADGSIITGKNSPLMHAASSLVLNAVKRLAEVPDKMHLLPPNIIESISYAKTHVLQTRQISLSLDETLIALSISATSNPAAQMAVEKLKDLRGCEVHLSHMPTPGDEAGLRRLGVNLTSDPNFSTKCLFVT